MTTKTSEESLRGRTEGRPQSLIDKTKELKEKLQSGQMTNLWVLL